MFECGGVPSQGVLAKKHTGTSPAMYMHQSPPQLMIFGIAVLASCIACVGSVRNETLATALSAFRFRNGPSPPSRSNDTLWHRPQCTLYSEPENVSTVRQAWSFSHGVPQVHTNTCLSSTLFRVSSSLPLTFTLIYYRKVEIFTVELLCESES